VELRSASLAAVTVELDAPSDQSRPTHSASIQAQRDRPNAHQPVL
jgi:hypothetical protein